jgi:hypothetical protein
VLRYVAVGFGGRAGIDAASHVFVTAPVVVGAGPMYGPWLVGPVTSLLMTGGAAPGSVPFGGAVGIAGTCESVPNEVARVPMGDGVCANVASASV